jgi:hypothetical protein
MNYWMYTVWVVPMIQKSYKYMSMEKEFLIQSQSCILPNVMHPVQFIIGENICVRLNSV